ncbi:MAG: porin family protein [Deltaproteobacteria bacterium]|nr:porin family protein [Deltaproteobacteria bacterium]
MKVHFIVLAALIALAAPSLCSATPPRPGPYVSGFLGVSAPRDADVTGTYYDTDPYSPFKDRVEFDPGINIGGTGGFDYGLVRLEGELSYKQGEIATVTDQLGVPYRNADGTLGALAMMFNVFMDLHNPSPVTPYFGGGIGFAAIHLSDTFLPGDSLPIYEEDDDSVFAYQVGAGLEIALNRMLSLDLGYRYFATTKARFVSSYNMDTELKFQSHNAAVGLRVKF